MEKTIRIWNGCKVVQIVSVSDTGSTTLGASGGAENSTQIDIEMDPWTGLLVDHSVQGSPVPWRDHDKMITVAWNDGRDSVLRQED